jgi:hypothetical protein
MKTSLALDHNQILSAADAPPNDAFKAGFAGIDKNIDAQMARRAGRMNASSISNDEETQLHAERQKLLDKQFDNTITRAESIRLEYVRWSLDRIDDAKHGQALDALEQQIARYEAFAAEVRDLKAQLQAHASRRR